MRDAHISHSSAQPKGPARKRDWLADGPGGSKAKGAVLQTAGILSLTCGYIHGSRISSAIRQAVYCGPGLCHDGPRSAYGAACSLSIPADGALPTAVLTESLTQR